MNTREIIDGLAARIGIDGVQPNNYTSFTLREIAREVLGDEARGLGTDELASRAMTSADFSNIMTDVANKAMLEGFDQAEESYDTWCDTSGRVNDFREHVFARASEAPSLVEVNPDGGEYQYSGVSDAKEVVTAVDYGIIVPFTRKAMVNDDIGALADIREKLGGAAKRKYGDLVYAVLTGNPAMGDGYSLFDASNHVNYITAGGAPSVATLNVGAAAMATQKDLQSLQNLNIRPEYIIAPWALKGTIDNLLVTTNPVMPGTTADLPVVNPWSYLKPAYDARLDASNAAGWYLAGQKGKTVKLFFLGGNGAPSISTKEGWAVDGMEFKCRVTAAAKAVDFRGLFFNDGVT